MKNFTITLLAVLILTVNLKATIPHQESILQIEEYIESEVQQSTIPGAVLLFERKGSPIYQKSFGKRALVPKSESITLDTIYDTASLTKILVTAPAILQLVEQGKLEITKPVSEYIPEFVGETRSKITLHHLLTHSSGLPPGLPLDRPWEGTCTAIELACKQVLRAPPGEKFIYSDINYILLGEIIHQISGKALHQYAQEHIFQPLGMHDTGYLPQAGKLPRIAPTDHTGEGQSLLRGIVHDPTARRMDGAAGHAGVFSTGPDLSRFARMLLNGGELDGKRILTDKSVALLTSNQLPEGFGNKRGYGMDIHTGYSSPRGNLFPVGSYGHTGFTGPTLWVSPSSDTYYIFLTNRNHPNLKASVVPMRRKLGTLIAEATTPFRPTVLNGIDTLQRDNFKPLHKLKVGLITNHTGRNAFSIQTIDLLHESRNVELRVLFSPEHGIRGKLDVAKINDSTDPVTGLPIYSLYGKTREPTAEQLQNLDALVFDIQDIGSRYYTYLSTMGNCMKVAAKYGKKFFVLDRINPIGGSQINGFPLKAEESFVRYHDIPIRHGMTAGELARMFNEEKNLGADLTVIPLKNWKRHYYQDQTDLPWRNPSPNMRNLTQAILYPAIGMIEFCNVSVGRGTDAPFETMGAPWIDHLLLAQQFNAKKLPGISALPIEFTPKSSKFAGKTCYGLNFHITNRQTFRPIETGLTIAQLLHQNQPEKFGIDKINTLLGHLEIIEELKSNRSIKGIFKQLEVQEQAFEKRRVPYLLYP